MEDKSMEQMQREFEVNQLGLYKKINDANRRAGHKKAEQTKTIKRLIKKRVI